MSTTGETVTRPQLPQMTELDQVIAYHNGDMFAAVETLLKDCRYLREQLTWAGAAVSVGFTRGWRPSTDTG